MKKCGLFVFCLSWALTVVTSHAVPNPAAAYAEKLGYVYSATEAGGTVTMPDGAVLDAWEFFRGKVGSEYAYGARYGYDTVNRRVETNGYVQSFAVCVPKDSLKKSTPAEIPLLDLMKQNGEPLWENSRGAPPPAVEAIMRTAPLKTFPKGALPSTWDWRNRSGLSYIGAVRNQGSCGSCYSFGAAAAAEGAFNLALGKTGSACVDFSEAYIAWCLGAYGAYSSHFGGCDGADYDYQELEALTVEGICGENQMPYNSGNDPGSCTYGGTTTVFEAWYRVPSGNIDAIKTAIMTYGVVDAAVLTDNAFMNYDTGVFDNNNNDCNSGYNETSDHAISLVGWDDNPPEGGGGVFILRNSWGSSGTGEGGYMRIRTNAAVVHCAVCYMVYDSSISTTSAPTFSSGTNYTATTGVARVFTVVASGNPAPALSLLSSTASAGSYVFSNATGVLTYTPPTNDVGTRTFTFRATNIAGSVTQTVGVAVSLAPPATPASIWASATNTTDFTAAWSSASGATGYRLDVGTNSTFSGGGGGGATNLVAEGFASASPAGWTIAAGGTYSSSPYIGSTLSGNYSIKFSATGNSAVTPTFAAGATNLQFWCYGNGSGTASTFAISGLVNSVWTLVDTESIAIGAGTYNVTLNPQTTQVGLYFTKNGYNCALDDVIVQGGAGTPSYVAGYSNRTVAGTSQSVTGLTAGAAYFFRVRGTNAAGPGAASSVASVTTLATLSAPVFNANPGPVATTAGVAVAFTVGAAGVPTPTLALSSQTASTGYSFNSGTGELTYTPPQADTGARTFTFAANNSQGAAAQTVTVAVTAATAPAFTGGTGPYSTTTGVAVAFTVSASGTPAATLALQGTTASSNYSFNPGTGQLSYTPPANDIGARTFTFTASNVAGVATQTTSVTVSDLPAAAPVFGANPGPLGATTGVARAFTVSATGYPAPALALQSTTASSGYSFTPATGALNYTPPEADAGTKFFVFTASNSAGVASQTVSVAVTAGIPGAPAAIWASATNSTGFTATWSAVLNATSYRLDVGTNATFAGGGASGAATNCAHDGTLGNGTGGTWTETGLTQGSGYLISLTGDALITPAMDFTASSAETLNFKARTYGGVNSNNNTVVVSVSTNNGSSWATLGTRTPLSTTLTAMNPFDLSAYDHAQVAVKFETPGATAAIGAGLDDVLVTNLSGGAASAFVPGYSNLTVSGTSQSVTGLAASATYYFRARAVNASGTGANSSVASATTTSNAPAGTPPVMNAAASQAALTGRDVAHTATATPTDGDPILSYACTSAVDNATWDFDPGTGDFLFVPTAAQIGANIFAFTATDKDGTSAPAAMTVTVSAASAPTMNAFSNRAISAGATLEVTATATEPDGDAVTFACTSAVDGAVWAVDTNGYFMFEPTPAQIGTNLFSFTAADRDGTSAPAVLTVRVYSTAATNDFTQWVEDEGENPASSNFFENADYDGDGRTTWEEYVADTDPAASNSVLALAGNYFIASQVSNTTGQIRFSFPASPNRFYQLEYCTGLTNHLVGTTNLGWGVPGMVVTSSAPATWYGVIRVFLQEP